MSFRLGSFITEAMTEAVAQEASGKVAATQKEPSSKQAPRRRPSQPDGFVRERSSARQPFSAAA